MTEQSASVVLWEIDLTEVGGERYFFCNEQNGGSIWRIPFRGVVLN